MYCHVLDIDKKFLQVEATNKQAEKQTVCHKKVFHNIFPCVLIKVPKIVYNFCNLLLQSKKQLIFLFTTFQNLILLNPPQN